MANQKRKLDTQRNSLMNKEQLDRLNLIIRENFINPDDYPNVKKNKELIGHVYKNDYDDSGNWFSENHYLNVIQRIAKKTKDTEIIIIEDFEREYKSSGEVVRLNNAIKESWKDFNDFTVKTDMISFFALGKSQDWVIWANRDYWCILVKKSIYNSINLEFELESNIGVFNEADEEFVSFLKNLHS